MVNIGRKIRGLSRLLNSVGLMLFPVSFPVVFLTLPLLLISFAIGKHTSSYLGCGVSAPTHVHSCVQEARVQSLGQTTSTQDSTPPG